MSGIKKIPGPPTIAEAEVRPYEPQLGTLEGDFDQFVKARGLDFKDEKIKEAFAAAWHPTPQISAPENAKMLDEKAMAVCVELGIPLKEDTRGESPTFRVIRHALQEVFESALLVEETIKQHNKRREELDVLAVGERNKVTG